jgi:type IV secretion system protein VirB4
MPSAGIVQQKDGSLLACLRFRGPDLHSSLDIALVAQARRLNTLFRRFGGGWGLMTEARRREVRTYPVAEWPDPVSRLVDQERWRYFTQPGQLYETDTILTLVYRRAQALLAQWKYLLYTNLPTDTREDEMLARFEEEVSRVQALLGGCCEGVERMVRSDLLTYLHSTVSFKIQRVAVPTPACYLDTYLTDTDLERTRVLPSLLRWPRLGQHWIRCVGVKAYPQETQPGLLDALESLPLEYRATLRYLPLDRAKAVSELRKYRKAHWGQRKSAGAAAVEYATGEETELLEQVALDWEKQANQAQADVQHGVVNYGYLTQTVVVWDTDFAAATAKAELVEHTLNSVDFTAKVETLNTMDAWVGTLPGNVYANVRRPLLHSHNLAHLMPATAPWPGPTRNAHLDGPPLLRTTGRGQTPFNLDTYDGDVGMAYIAGPIGSGKSTLLATMMLQWLKYPGAEVKIVDTGQSLRCATYAVGGQWYDVAAELQQQMARGQRLDDPETKPWGSPWMPPAARWQCFEMEDLLKTPDVMATIMRPLLQTLKERLTGAPTLFVFDEAHLYLKHEMLADGIDDYIRGLRKKNGAVLMATQSIADAARSALAPIISDSAMTRIFLANYHALEPQTAAIYEGWGLNARQREIIAALVPKREYYYQGRQGHRVFDLKLGPVGLAFAGASRKADLALMSELYKGNGVQFACDWLHARGLHQQADSLKSEGEV